MMRHLGSMLLTPVLAVLALALAGRGTVELPEAVAATPPDVLGIAAGASALGLAGLLYGWLVLARFSPLGPALAGGGYLAVGGWALADPDGFLAAVPGEPVGLTEPQLTAAAAVAPLLAVPLLMTLFFSGRWRRRERPGPAAGTASSGYRDADPTRTLDDIPPVPAGPPVPPGPPQAR